MIDVDRVIRRIQDNLKEHKGERASVAHPDNGPFSILRLPEWGSKTLWVLNSNGDQVQRILPQYYKKPEPYSLMNLDLYHLDAEDPTTRQQLPHVDVDAIFSALAAEVKRTHPTKVYLSSAHATNSPFRLSQNATGGLVVYNKHDDQIFELPSSASKTDTPSSTSASDTHIAGNSSSQTTEHSTQSSTDNNHSPLQVKALDTMFDESPTHSPQQPAPTTQMDVEAPPFYPATSIVSIDDYALDATDAFTSSQKSTISPSLLFAKLRDICSKDIEPAISTAHPTHGPFRITRNKASPTGLMVITNSGKKVCMVTGNELMSNPSSTPVSGTQGTTSGLKGHFKIAADKHTKLYQKKYLVSVLQTLSQHLSCAHADKGPFRVHHTKSAGYMLINKDKELVFDLDHPRSPE